MSPEMAHAARYYRWVFERIAPHLGDRILDIGGGYGSHLEPVLDSGRGVVSIDHSPEAARSMNERFASRPAFEALCADFSTREMRRELVARGFDTILCLNVLEHIEDDLAALRHMAEFLAPSEGTLVLQVPAHPWLYGRLDSLAGHHRRYTAPRLERQMRQAGFTDPRVFYFNRFGVLPWFVTGRILKPARLDSHGVGAQVKIFDRYLVPVARLLDTVLPLPLGQSLIAVARAPRGQTC